MKINARIISALHGEEGWIAFTMKRNRKAYWEVDCRNSNIPQDCIKIKNYVSYTPGSKFAYLKIKRKGYLVKQSDITRDKWTISPYKKTDTNKTTEKKV